MSKQRVQFDVVDWLLMAAIVGLSAFLLWEVSWPAIDAWRNRIRPGVQVIQTYVFDEKGHDAGNAAEINYLFYLPREYEKGKKWPLLVFLHGSGGQGEDFSLMRREGLPRHIDREIEAQRDKTHVRAEQHDGAPIAASSTVVSADINELILNRFIVLSPQCPHRAPWTPEFVDAIVEHICDSFSVDRDRVYLTGFSKGGFATWDIACHEPDRFAAIVPLAGGGDAAQAERLKDMPIWAFHGSKDDVVSLNASEEMVEAVRKCGGHAELTVFPEGGHQIWDATYRNPKLLEWLLAQQRSQPSKESVQTQDQSR